MRRNVLLAALGLSLLSGCGTTTQASPFTKPNSLMAEEIDTRIAQIPFQHREELVENLMWLTQTGEQAIPSLITALEHDSPKVRSNSAWVLGQIGDRRTISYLQRLADDRDERVRLEVARTLVLMGDMSQTGTLIEGLDSDRKEVRYMCHEALKSATRRDFGYDHLAVDVSARDAATYKWRQWWGEVAGDPYFAASYASQKGIDLSQPEIPMGMPAAPGGEMAPMPAQGQGGANTGAQGDPIEVPSRSNTAPQGSQPQGSQPQSGESQSGKSQSGKSQSPPSPQPQPSGAGGSDEPQGAGDGSQNG